MPLASFYRKNLLHRESFTQRCFYTQKPLHREAFTHKPFRTTVQEIAARNRISAPKRKKTILKHFFNGFFKRKITSTKIEKICWQIIISQPRCSHSTTIYDVQLQKTIVLRTQSRRQATLMQPLHCDPQILRCKTQKNYAQERHTCNWVAKHTRTTHNGVRNCSSKTGSRCQSNKKTILKHFFIEFLKENHQYQNWENLLTNHYGSLDAATPLRRQATLTQPLQSDLQRLSCKTQ